MTEPTYLRAAVEDWRAGRIVIDKLIELWARPFHISGYDALNHLCDASGGMDSRTLPTDRICEILRKARG